MIYKCYTIIVCWLVAVFCGVMALEHTSLSGDAKFSLGLVWGAFLTFLCMLWWAAWEDTDL